MTGRLYEKYRDFLIVNGREEGRRKISRALKRSGRTLQRWEQKEPPSEQERYQLALACGCSEEEALEIAKECSSERGRKTAS